MINRRIALSAMSILTALGMTAGTTFALFTAQASSNGNSIGSGSLTLTVTPNGGAVSSPAFTITNAMPGDVMDKDIVLQDTGTVAATSVLLKNITVGTADLAPALTLDIYNDLDNTGTVTAGDTLAGSAHINDAAWTNIPLGFGLTAGGTHHIVARVTFDSTADDSFQGKTATFNLNFQANQ